MKKTLLTTLFTLSTSFAAQDFRDIDHDPRDREEEVKDQRELHKPGQTAEGRQQRDLEEERERVYGDPEFHAIDDDLTEWEGAFD